MGSEQKVKSKVIFHTGISAFYILIIAVVLMLNGCQNSQPIEPEDAGDSLDKGKPRFKVQLSGDQEVPYLGQSGSGFATIFINERKNTVTYEINVSGILLPGTGAHIHNAPAGVNGPIVVNMFPPPDETGYSSGVVTVNNPALLQDIKQNPENYYVNVHNSEYPGGAVRGQLK